MSGDKESRSSLQGRKWISSLFSPVPGSWRILATQNSKQLRFIGHGDLAKSPAAFIVMSDGTYLKKKVHRSSWSKYLLRRTIKQDNRGQQDQDHITLLVGPHFQFQKKWLAMSVGRTAALLLSTLRWLPSVGDNATIKQHWTVGSFLSSQPPQ